MATVKIGDYNLPTAGFTLDTSVCHGWDFNSAASEC